jgi:hypothetical protein
VYHIVKSALGGWFVSAKSDNTHTTVVKVFADGTFGQTWTITHATRNGNTIGCGVSPDETILYYAITGTNAVAVQRWDLVADVALTDLVAGIANYQVMQDIVVLADGTILVGHKKISVTIDGNVHQYSPAGTLLTTIAFGANSMNRMNRALDDPASFWMWIYVPPANVSGLNRYVNARLSDGAFLVDFTVAQYRNGNYQAAATATPLARFGPGFSCPLWIMPVTATPPIPPPPTPTAICPPGFRRPPATMGCIQPLGDF